MKKKELINIGLGQKDVLDDALSAVIAAAQAGLPKTTIRRQLKDLVDRPADFFGDQHWSGLARRWAAKLAPGAKPFFRPRDKPAPFRRWGGDIEAEALQQLENACALPVAVAGALMPDAHVGYGLPIGGVLATRRSVIPYAVGVDIACRVKMTIFDAPVGLLDGERDRLRKALERETRFGVGSEFRDRRQHAVIDDDWSVSPVTKKLKDKAWAQLGTSGSGNHFVELGEVEVPAAVAGAPSPGRGGRTLEPGRYLALLSHSGSRGTGAAVCDHYSRIAISRHEDLPGELKRLSWLDLDSQEGQEYWQAMNLMGRYASANHALIHQHLAKALGFEVIFDVENHHNFAWEEEHLGERLIVHRKGATPAGRGVLGIIPGSMASPAYLVRGKGQPDSLDSAAHGAGRVMSRKKAKQTFTWSETRKLLREREVELISADIDEAPMVYRDIDKVMAAQADLVEKVARFFPRIVKMAPAGERAED